jgi:multidrug resistance efflux pump
VSESTTNDKTSTSLPAEESTSASPNQPATAGTRSKSPAILVARKRRLRIAFIVLGALVIVFVIIPRVFHAWHTVSTDDAYVNT